MSNVIKTFNTKNVIEKKNFFFEQNLYKFCKLKKKNLILFHCKIFLSKSNDIKKINFSKLNEFKMNKKLIF